MKPPKTPDEWWSNLNTAWSDILDIFGRCDAPLSRDDFVYSDGIGKEATLHDKSLIRTLEEAKEACDHETMLKWLNLCWLAAPDASHIHWWPNWGTLCDLCSESWVFNPDEAEIEIDSEDEGDE